MSLADLLVSQNIRSAIIVDDVYDDTPTASDIGAGNEAWSVFSDDLTPESRELIAANYTVAGRRLDELVHDDAYVATLWKLRERLGAAVAPLFELYIADMEMDKRYVQLVKDKLEALGIACETAGRDFGQKAEKVDLIVIDLFFGTAQDASAMAETKGLLRTALQPRVANPPMVILMSRSPRIEVKRDEFRDEVGLIDSAFRIIRKAELEAGDRLETQLERLANNAEDSRKLAQFFYALDVGLADANRRTLKILRKLKLSDSGQIQKLLLKV